MTVKVKYSNNYEAIKKRIQRAPVILENKIQGFIKRDLKELNEEFKKGIKKRTFPLVGLAAVTVEEKEDLGYSKPTTPLYGLGSETDRSYINMMEIVKVGKNFVLRPKNINHHKAKMRLKKLLIIHENGATIKKKTKTGTIMIEIPPRPAFWLAYRRWLIKRRRSKNETSKKVKKLLTQYINRGVTT